MHEFASRLGVPYLDLLEAFAGHDAETLRVSLANEHPNALGHRLAAERIARFLRDDVLPLRDRQTP
jgi:lysophospholipase L1-like esterase